MITSPRSGSGSFIDTLRFFLQATRHLKQTLDSIHIHMVKKRETAPGFTKNTVSIPQTKKFYKKSQKTHYNYNLGTANLNPEDGCLHVRWNWPVSAAVRYTETGKSQFNPISFPDQFIFCVSLFVSFRVRLPSRDTKEKGKTKAKVEAKSFYLIYLNT